MWDFLTEAMRSYGWVAVVQVAEALLIAYLFKQVRNKDKEISESHADLQDLANKRLEDVKESKEDYEDLSRDLNRSLDILIKMLNR
ncbi:MAG: hypothetical protein DRH90_25535 [Deltaproteobacteria bacterium]|nr:MAG: hypothetical protein DRH90_25535 [Deltaproteobacteria bacterium]